MKTLTLAEAVNEVVQENVNKANSFSAYDITKEIRARSSAQYDLSDAPQHPTQPYKEVEHQTVRSLVHNLMRTQYSNIYDNQNSLGYLSYSPSVKSVIASTPNGGTTRVFGTRIVTHTLSNNGLTPTAFDRAISYIKNRAKPTKVHPVPTSPTLKQVQSVLKRHGHFTCADIRRALSNDARVSFKDNTVTPSKTTVSVASV